MLNGNRQVVIKELPLIHITGKMNEIALEHIKDETGLFFHETGWDGNYEAQPISANQIVRLFLTYNFKTRYYDNHSNKNTLFLKNDHHVGFDVSDICMSCARRNRIHTGDMKEGDLLAC